MNEIAPHYSVALEPRFAQESWKSVVKKLVGKQRRVSSPAPALKLNVEIEKLDKRR